MVLIKSACKCSSLDTLPPKNMQAHTSFLWLMRKNSAYGVMKIRLEGKDGLLMRGTTKVDWHVNVWLAQINGPHIYQDRQ